MHSRFWISVRTISSGDPTAVISAETATLTRRAGRVHPRTCLPPRVPAPTSDLRPTPYVGRAASSPEVRAGTRSARPQRARRTHPGRALRESRSAGRTRSPALPWPPLVVLRMQLVGMSANTTSVVGHASASVVTPHIVGTQRQGQLLRQDETRSCTQKRVPQLRIGHPVSPSRPMAADRRTCFGHGR